MAGKVFALKNSAAADQTFTPTILVSGGTQYANTTSPTIGETASVKHTMPPASQISAVDRHLVQFQVLKVDSNGKPVFATLNVTISMPRSVVSRADLNHLLAHASDLLSDTVIIDTLLLGDY